MEDAQAPGSGIHSAVVAVLMLAGVALLVVLPFLYFGTPSGHDFEFHLNSWMEVADQWKQGVVYPHWDAMAHYGYGEARFIFYPPLSWTLGAALGFVLPWKLVSAAYLCMVLTLSGCSMFLLARRWLGWSEALFAAAFYTANPYHLVIVYWRSAMAELLCAAYLPLLLLLVLRLEDDGPRIVAPLSLLLATGWLTNVPGAVMMNYSLAVLVLWIAISRRSLVVAGYATLASVFGAGLAAIYLLPAFHQQHWVSIAQVFAPGVHPQDNFIFTITNDPDHNHFNLLVSIVAASEIVMVAAMLFLSRQMQVRKLWWAMVAWSAICILLMLRPTLVLWMHMPELRFVQLPWRWLLCLNVPLALAIPLALRRWWLRGLICLAALGVVLVVWHRLLVPWWDTAADVQEMLDNQHDGIGNEGTDEYVPAGIDSSEANRNAPLARFEGAGKAHVRVLTWHSESRLIALNAGAPGQLVMRLFNYPLWDARVNGLRVQTQSAEPAGQMLVPVPAGQSRVEIEFVEGWDRKVGALISCLMFSIVVIWFLISRRRLQPAPA